jgi:hypothetical protein
VLVVEADLRDPGAVIGGARGLIDFGEPVALLLFAVLHFLTDTEQPRKVVHGLAEALAPGSAVALSHITAEAIAPEASQAVQKVYQGASAPAVPRSRKDIIRFFDGLELTDPGVTDISRWPIKAAGPGIPLAFYGGVARKRGDAALRILAAPVKTAGGGAVSPAQHLQQPHAQRLMTTLEQP